MRTELASYAQAHPPSWQGRAARRIEELRLRVFCRKVREIPLGSPAWHKLQEELGHGSSVGLDQDRRNAFYSLTLESCGRNIFVHPLVAMYYPRNIHIGDNVFVNRGTIIMAPVKISIGNNVLIGPYCIFNSGSHIYASREVLIDEQGHKYEPISIEDDVWVGGQVCVLPGVTLARGSVVAAGAVVAKSVDPYTVVGGIPAKVIGARERL